MAELVGLVLTIFFVLLFFLPLLTFLRLGRLSRELAELTDRVAALESAPAGHDRATSGGEPGPAQSASGSPASPFAHEEFAPVVPVAPVASEITAGPLAPDTDGAEEPDLEERIGGRGLLYTGVLILIFGVSFFLKYAFDNAWVNETGRSVLGALAGLGLIGAGLRTAAAGLGPFGHALVGTGCAILYLVVYAALNFYDLIGRGAAFTLMALITLAAAAIADRQRSQPLAFIAVGGGFLTPALVGGNENQQLTLFSYDAVLVIGTLLLSLRHQWFALNALSYLGTLITVVAWTVQHYTDHQWLRTLLFLTLFCVCFCIILRATHPLRTGADLRRSPLALVTLRGVRILLYTAPVLYHLAAIVITAAHPPAIHVYLIAFTVVGLLLTVDPYRPALRLVTLLGGLIPLFGTLTLPGQAAWLVPNVVTIVAIAVLHVMALVDRVVRQEQPLRGADLLALHLTGLGLFALLYEALQRTFPGFRGGLAAIVAVAAIGLAQAFKARDPIASTNSVALAFTLAAIGIAVQFDGAAALIGWAAEGVAAVWLGVAARRLAFQGGGFLLWTFAALRWFDGLTTTPAAFTAIVNARSLSAAFVVIAGYLMAWRLGGSDKREAPRMRIGVHVIASILTLGWITAEIRSFWEVRYETPQAYLYEQMLLSLAWGLYGAAVIAVGMVKRFAPLRYIGIVVIALTSLKVFFYDLWELGGIYRVIGFIGFGGLLMLVSYLYQRKRVTARLVQSPPPPPPPPSQPPPPSEPQSEPPSANTSVPSEPT